MAPERALTPQFQALVYVFADLIGSGCETFAASALESTVNVGAGTIATNILYVQALVIVDTLFTRGIEHVSRWAFASE